MFYSLNGILKDGKTKKVGMLQLDVLTQDTYIKKMLWSSAS